MKNVKKLGAQGDVIFRRVDKLPAGVRPSEEKRPIVAHSETGHHHVAQGGTLYETSDPLIAFLKIDRPTVVKHERAWDTHESLKLLNEGGGEVIYEIRRQRQRGPQGWERVND